MSSSTSSGSLKPSRLKNLIPLYSGALCEAEMTTPPSASSSRTRSATAGVGTMPATERVGAAGADAGDQRGLEHLAAASSVSTDDDLSAALLAEEVAGGLAQPERELRGEFSVRDTADAIGSEEPCHAIPLTKRRGPPRVRRAPVGCNDEPRSSAWRTAASCGPSSGRTSCARPCGGRDAGSRHA